MNRNYQFFLPGFLIYLFITGISLSTFATGLLSDDEIYDFLEDSIVEGNQNGLKWSQTFESSGFTEFRQKTGQATPPSVGYWRIQDGDFCSRWPPSTTWECFDLHINPPNVTFIPKTGGAPWPGVVKR